MMIISAWWLRRSTKLGGMKSEKQLENSENGQLLSRCRFVHSLVSPSLSRDRRIKMEETNKLQQNSIVTKKLCSKLKKNSFCSVYVSIWVHSNT